MRGISQAASILLLLGLAACATPPSRINDVCAVLDQNDGWFSSWRGDVKKAERRHGVPAHILMATLRKESGFKHNARPPRTKLMGFIPWSRQSTAYGYSQALDGTWAQYQAETGNFMARRTDFADAVDFVGWFHAKSSDTLGIARDDAYNLYLAYYSGWGGYQKGVWRSNASLQNYARDTAGMAESYKRQMERCGS